jgi:N-acetylglutamate synthase-like GNAT family acetyltransferase
MTAAFSIRTATPDDADAVTGVLTASYPVLMDEAYDMATLAVALPYMVRANPTLLASGCYYMAETADGMAVGCGGWSHERPGSGEREPGLAHVRHFATHPDWAGRGVGRALFGTCVRAASAQGVHRFEVYASLNAEGFYRALGFETIESLDIPMGDGTVFPSLRMARTVTT